MPGTAVPKIGAAGTELEYLRWAQNSLGRGQKAEAELSLEWGQARDRVHEEELAYRNHLPPPPYDKLCERMMCMAMRSIGFGHPSDASGYIGHAIQDVTRRDALIAAGLEPTVRQPQTRLADRQ
jgi:hypothetical protein